MFQIHLEAATPSDRDAVVSRLRAWAEEHGTRLIEPAAGPGGLESAVYLPELPEISLLDALKSMPGVDRVEAGAAPGRLVEGRAPATVAVGPAIFGGGNASFIAGPCAVEREEPLIALARKLKSAGATALRGGAFKPRTSPYGFQGLGRAGLEMLAAARAATGLPVVTEVLDPRDLELVAEYADVLQIGSRNMSNSALLQEAGRAGMPVLLKRGMSATLDEFLYAAEYIAIGGCTDILLCERGLRHFDPSVRNLLDLSAVPALKLRTGLPVIVDPSHGTGRSALVPTMIAAAAAAGADGFLVEVHGSPADSWSDSAQALAPDTFASAVERADAVLTACGRSLARAEPTPAPER